MFDNYIYVCIYIHIYIYSDESKTAKNNRGNKITMSKNGINRGQL